MNLAVDNNLSRQATPILEDGKVVGVTVEIVVMEGGRTSRFDKTSFYFDAETSEAINASTLAYVDIATDRFMGVNSVPVVTVTTTTEGTPKPAKKVTAKKAATKKAATKKAETKPEAAPELAKEDSLDEFGDLGGLGEEVEPVMYNKSLSDHGAALSENIREVLGADWKKDEASKTKVRKVIASLNGKVPCMDVEGNVLESFNTFCKEGLA